jgi:cation transport regulator
MYRTVSELPKGVKSSLPKHAQEIYKSTFNSAHEEQDHDKQAAHKIAWSAVKQSYEKQGGNWHKK